MASLLDNSMNFLKECYVAFYDRFGPYFVYSTTCHIMNLANQMREFYFVQGKPAQNRLHLFFVAPPGFTKTLMLQKFLDGKSSIVGCTDTVETSFENAMTEAGFVGTFKVVQGEPMEVPGAAYEHRMSIVGIDEFSVLSNAMRMEHSINLDNAMLTALDSGWCIKRLALGKIQYMTNITVITGSQPARFNLASGLGRRFLFIYFIPTLDEQQTIKEWMRKGENVYPNRGLLSKIRTNIIEIQDSLKDISRVQFDSSFYTMIDKIRIPHYEEKLFKNLAIGYYLAANNGCDKIMDIEMTSLLEKHIKQANSWRMEIKKGAETSQVFLVCKELSGSTISEVKMRLTDFGIEYSTSARLLEQLVKQGRIEIVKPAVEKPGRPGKIIIAKH